MNATDFAQTRVPRDKPRAKYWLRPVLFVLALPVVVLGGQLVLSAGEGYCWVWPSIATTFTKDYSERKFARVEVGMTPAEVVALIGRPLFRHPFLQRRGHPAYRERGDEVWSYSMEGAGSWAWLSREIIFRDGRVVQKVYWTYYD